MVRQNITEGQEGLPLTVEVDFIDIETCEPVPVRTLPRVLEQFVLMLW